ncbi:MAG: 50S ribosomal protein L18e [Candidatus Pacearchaeota archaeon]|nr:50S ribosomal protein L18e [Candidatus Pacearchaeota archaeon]
MGISKNKIKKRTGKKRSDEIIKTISAANKLKKWSKVAQFISGSRRKYKSINLNEISSQTKEGDTALILGNVLGVGSVNKKIKICAINFSESARKKLIGEKIQILNILEEIKKNPNAEGIKIIK